MVELDEKKRIIQEFVPGKQVTLAHVIANPTEDLYAKLGLIDAEGSSGHDDHAKRRGHDRGRRRGKGGECGDRLCRPLQRFACHHGDVAAVEAALKDVMRVLCDMMGFSPASISKT